MRTIFCSVRLAFIISLWGLAPALAQVGGVAGTVKDSSGAVLPGARVQVEQGPSAVSDAQGQFLISNVPPGTHKVTVSYVGFSPFDTSVDVTAGQIAHPAPTPQLNPPTQVSPHN